MNLAGGLQNLGHEVDLLVLEDHGPLFKDIPPQVRVINLNTPKTILAVPKLRSYFSSSKPDAIISFLIHANLATVLANMLSGHKVISLLTVHNNYSTVTKVNTSLKWKIMRQAAKILYRESDRVIGVSRGVAQDTISILNLPTEKVKYIYNPVVTPDIEERVARSRADVKASFKPHRVPRIVAVGRLAPQKDFANLLRAFRIVRNRKVCKLTIFGEGPSRKDLEDLVAELDLQADVEMPGFVDDVLERLVDADLFVLSSKHEGLPTVIIEALAAGCKVVSTDCPSGPNELLRSGDYGRLVPVGDPTALADAISSSLDEPIEMNTAPDSWIDQFRLLPVAQSYVDSIIDLRKQASI